MITIEQYAIQGHPESYPALTYIHEVIYFYMKTGNEKIKKYFTNKDTYLKFVQKLINFILQLMIIPNMSYNHFFRSSVFTI